MRHDIKPAKMTLEQRAGALASQQRQLDQIRQEVDSLGQYEKYWTDGFFRTIWFLITFRWIGYKLRCDRLDARIENLVEENRPFITWASEIVEDDSRQDTAPYAAMLDQLDQLMYRDKG